MGKSGMGSASVIIRAGDLQPRPWPNGLGVTREVVTEGRTEAAFGWQIGIADLADEATFSHFPGCDRIFTLIEGPGATLTLEGRGPLPCRPWVPASFPGDVPTHYRPAAGPARAFNVIADREAFEARVAVRSIAASHPLRCGAASVAIFCGEGTLETDGVRLEAGDTMLHPGPASFRAIGQAALAVIVDIARAEAPVRPSPTPQK
jgi:environmental stress-induced protein Ves